MLWKGQMHIEADLGIERIKFEVSFFQLSSESS